ncbi:MAG: hypothetical protein L6Q92_09415 [Phycisphaerae bacterium]|nr:hypothetical protein [Phycisphaerae bacterium]
MYSFQFRFKLPDPRVHAVLKLAHAEGLSPFERFDEEYTDAELRTYPMLGLGCARASIDEGGPQRGVEYDLSAGCPRCGTGAIQTSPLLVWAGKLPKHRRLCSTHRGHRLIRDDLAEAIIAAGIGGAELRQVRSVGRKALLPWRQILPEFTMPRMSRHSTNLGRDTAPGWGCPVCERDMHVALHRRPLDIAYDRSAVAPETLPDIVQTWECFGRSLLHDDPKRGLIRGFAQPKILVKPRVFELFRELNVKEADFRPVRFV